MESATPSDIQSKLESLQPLRWAVERIEPDTIVVTFAQSLAAAVQHYQTLTPSLPSLPCFFLVDCEDAHALPQQASETAAKWHLKIFFPTDLDSINTEKFCVYLTPQREPWGAFGHDKIFHYLLRYGIVRCGFDNICAKLFPIEFRLPVSSHYFQEVSFIYNRLADEDSREAYLRVIKARITGDAGYLPLANYPIYAHPLVHAQPGDHIIEGGVHNGLSTERFARAIGDEGRVVAFEAFPPFAEMSRKYLQKYPMVHIEQQGLYSTKKTFYMVDNSSGSFLQENHAKGAQVVKTVDIDSYVVENNIKKCDLLKLDIEGAEMECLKGAIKTLRTHRPKLQISIYHMLHHYFSIPIFLMMNLPSYKFYLGHDCTWFNETIMYAINDEHSAVGNDFFIDTSSECPQQKNLLAGQDVIYVGCGAAYEQYKHLCKDCNPVAIAIDKYFISGIPAHLDGIPVKSFESLLPNERELPVVLFARYDYLLPLLERVEKNFHHNTPDKLLKYILA
ncbi:MAG: FkbM family methyltransferase [Desulfovibrio desulfuricans]|nr:FkbM family methyltransferase [Desulfovibrio desulfuricans]